MTKMIAVPATLLEKIINCATEGDYEISTLAQEAYELLHAPDELKKLRERVKMLEHEIIVLRQNIAMGR